MSATLAVVGWTAAVVIGFGLIRYRCLMAARSEAIGHACHEIRGPLAAARLALALGLRLGRLDPARLRALDLELERAVLAIEDLERARRGATALPLQPQAVDVHCLVAGSVGAWQGAAAAKGRQLRLQWSGPEVVICGDRVRLAQALGNLIANAIEHGRGPVDLRASGTPEGARIEVRDRGPGLEAPVAELVGRQRVGDRSRGLEIASSIAADHGGRLSSAPSDAGARLVITLPADATVRSARTSRV